MFPGTIVRWFDQSAINAPEVPEAVDDTPIFLQVSSFDKGPEDIRLISGNDFYNLYGSTMSFERHGQPAIQAANIINGGGRLLLKRLVADDATLANIIATATVTKHVNAVLADESTTGAKTVEEILGKETESTEYTSNLEIISEVGSTAGTTKLTVETVNGHKYYWKTTNSDSALVLNTPVTAEYTEWDGTSDIAVADGTKIIVVEAVEEKIVAAGVITVVSAIAHPNAVSTAIEGVDALSVVSNEGATVGTTALTVTPAKAEGNVYAYAKTTDVTLPSNGDEYTSEVYANWTEWDGTSDIELEDGTQIVLAEFSVNEEDAEAITHAVVKAATVAAVSKLPADTRTAESTALVVPSQNVYTVTTTSTSVKWNAVSVTNYKTMAEVVEYAKTLANDDGEAVVTNNEDGTTTIETGVTIPMFVITDNGRGDINKSVRFIADHRTSNGLKNMLYDVSIFEGTSLLENVSITMNPSAIINDTLYGMNEHSSVQTIMHSMEGAFDKYIGLLEEYSGLTKEQLLKCDLLFMTNNRAGAIQGITLDPDSIDFGSDMGVVLNGGSNGAFGDKPFGTEAWADAAVDVFKGNFDDIIFDLDTYHIAAAFDANYPERVKSALSALANFREDFVYFRDYGIGRDTYNAIMTYQSQFAWEERTRYILDYYTTYEIYDPYTKIRERVTMMYDFANVMVAHFTKGAYLPMAGYANNIILDSAIEGTINFTPRITPTINQKELLDDARINYAIFEEGRCIVQSLYTSQLDYTQLSYGNNVLAIQEVIRAVRKSCPKNRFSFISGSDFSSYSDAVKEVLKLFQSNFEELNFVYTQDTVKAQQKIFYASIQFRFNNWAQTEVFDVYALPNMTESENQ